MHFIFQHTVSALCLVSESSAAVRMVERGANCQRLSGIFQLTAARLMQKVMNFNAGLFVGSCYDARLLVAHREAV